ncbi:hypothetical protein HMSSN139_43570 [Paenibacillus sp. HMSSN-139]|nr:hypothetical protein HMSSN139_43570 [Paenibacillus sp. HMSSN-139]
MLVLSVAVLGACGNTTSVFSTDTGSESELTTARVPWDYKIMEATVGDLVGSDMTILPDNDLLPNDSNYATGDKIWILQFMDAELTTDENQKNEVRLSSWTTLKSYPDQAAAEKDLAELKVSVTTDVNLVGVYKTEYQGKTRNLPYWSCRPGTGSSSRSTTRGTRRWRKRRRRRSCWRKCMILPIMIWHLRIRGWAK